MASDSFPTELLARPIKERLRYFDSYTLAHPIVKEIYQRIIQVLSAPAGVALVCIYGPTGVGKSTLSRRIEKYLKESFLAELEKDLNCIPVVGIEAVSPDSGNFNWRDYYKRALYALEEPLVEKKMDYKMPGFIRDINGNLNLGSRVSGTELRYALEKALKYRKPRAFLLDEAQHLTKMASGRKLQDHLDTIKSLANISATLHLLLGTYELLPIRNLSAQLSRRSLDIHFRRYLTDSEQDIEAFQSLLFSFQRHLPIAQEPDLLSHWEYCYERSIGCVGVLKDWLMRALQAALEEGAHTVKLKHLQQQANTLAQCDTMLKEALEGESELAEKKEVRPKLLALLGLEQHAPKPAIEINEVAADSGSTVKKRRGRPVGNRKPARDQVGR